MTLVELILYIAIVSMFVLSITSFLLNVVIGNGKNAAQNEVSDNINLIIKKMNYELGQASSITSADQNSLTVVSNDLTRGSAIFRLTGGVINYGYGNTGVCTYSSPCRISSNLVNVNSFGIAIVESSGQRIVNYSLDVEFNDSGNGKFSYSNVVKGSLYLRK